MNQYKALLINLGQGSSKVNRNNSKESRREEILEFIKEIAKDHQPDLVLFQEGTSKKFLKGDLVKVLNENIPDADFYLPPPSERGTADLIGVLVNEQKIQIMRDCNGKSLEVHRADALHYLRRTHLNFFTEDKRARVVLVKDKRTNKSLLIVSFHGKNQGTVKERTENVSHDDHIKMFLQFVAEMRTRLSCDQVLVGGDMNHVMENFVSKQMELCDSLDLHLLSYKVPDGYHRHTKDQIDYFLHSRSMKSVNEVKVFNVPQAFLDHHPLLATFQCETVEEDDGSSTLLDHASMAAAAAKAEASLKEATAHLSESTLGTGGWIPPKEEPSLSKEGTLSDSKVSSLNVASGLSAHPPKSTGVLPKEEPSQTTREAHSDFSSTVAFLCELCPEEMFSSRPNLFLHFSKAAGHHPCQKQFDDETEENKRICLRVFTTGRGLKLHQTKQAKNPRHHAAGKTFPNLKE